MTPPPTTRGMGQSPEPEPDLTLRQQAGPDSTPKARLTLSTSSFQSCGDHNRTAQQGREGGGTSQQGRQRGGGWRNARAPALPQLTKTPTSSHPFPSQLPPPTRPGAEAGVRPGMRGDTDHHSPVQHATCREGGQPAGKSCLGFSYSVSPQALTGVSRETEHPTPNPHTWLRLVGWEAGLCGPGPVTEPFCPLAEKGSLVPESHWGSMAKEINRAVSTLQDIAPSTRPRKGDRMCHPESKEERPPPPTTT